MQKGKNTIIEASPLAFPKSVLITPYFNLKDTTRPMSQICLPHLLAN